MMFIQYKTEVPRNHHDIMILIPEPATTLLNSLSVSLQITIYDILSAYLIRDQCGQGLHHEDDHEQHDDQDDTSSNNHDCIISGRGNIHHLAL